MKKSYIRPTRRLLLLIPLLFLVPFAVTVYLRGQDSSKDIAFVDKQIKGLKLHQTLFDLQKFLIEYRTNAIVYDHIGKSFDDDSFQQQMKTKLVEVSSMLQGDEFDDYTTIISAWSGVQRLIKDSYNSEQSIKKIELFETRSEAIRTLNILMRNLGRESNLILDPEIETYFTIDINVNIVPELLDNLSYVQGIIIDNLAHKTLDNAQLNPILKHIGAQNLLKDQYLYDVSIIRANDPENVSARVEQEIMFMSLLDEWQEMFTRIAKRHEGGAILSLFSEESEQVLMALPQIYQRFHEHLLWHLKERLHDLTMSRLWSIIGAIAAFIATAATFIYSYRNIAGKEEIEQARTKRLLSNIVESSDDAILSKTLDGIITSWNKGAEKMFGYLASEAVGKHITLLIPPDRYAEEADIIRQLHEGKTIAHFETVRLHKNSSLIHVSVSLSPMYDDRGLVVGASKVVRDISAQKTVEEKIRNYAAEMEMKGIELAAAKEQAEHATKLKSEFLANMSHEIRTPMNGVIGMTNLLLECDLDATERSYAETVQNSAEALLQIINDILDFSKIEAGKVELESIPFDLQLLCEEVTEILSIKAVEKKIELLLSFPHGTTRYVIGDPGRVRQILLNLLSNAIKFTDSGHVLLSLKHNKNEDGSLLFYVEIEDTGMGIPEDKTHYIFNKFSQADESTTRKFGGTGLGLSICKELVHLMGGDIGVRSTMAIGSTFWFSMRLGEDTSNSTMLAVPQAAVLKGPRCLIVDDSDIARKIIQEQLAAYGVEVRIASNGREALQLLERATFDCATIDYMMPHMDGAELAKAIRSNAALCDMVLIMITSAPNRGDKQKFEALGFSAYFNKPLMHWYLRDALALITNAKQEGTVLPMITQHTLKEARAGGRQPSLHNMHFHGAKVLLAEDNAVNQMVAKAMLEKYGCEVITAADGEEALRCVKKTNVDLVMMDCQMPHMDGYEATRMMRNLEIHQKRDRTPIIALTANALAGDSEKCYAAGMDDYITKPLRAKDLERVLAKWIAPEKRIVCVYDKAEEDDMDLQSAAKNISSLEEESFKFFIDLMGDNAVPTLRKYIQSAQEYTSTIERALAARNFKAIRDAAHPLKSSSAQIGATKLSAIARELEHGGASTSPNVQALAKRFVVLQQEYISTKAAINIYLSGKKLSTQ